MRAVVRFLWAAPWLVVEAVQLGDATHRQSGDRQDEAEVEAGTGGVVRTPTAAPGSWELDLPHVPAAEAASGSPAPLGAGAKARAGPACHGASAGGLLQKDHDKPKSNWLSAMQLQHGVDAISTAYSHGKKMVARAKGKGSMGKNPIIITMVLVVCAVVIIFFSMTTPGPPKNPPPQHIAFTAEDERDYEPWGVVGHQKGSARGPRRS
mmetsp:Transcript_101460/g.269792  ORF Transcript_101460/g.269792 Transcript_101460/m.269792 type:complete len:208 (-) Transcript_101460:106-729(-)